MEGWKDTKEPELQSRQAECRMQKIEEDLQKLRESFEGARTERPIGLDGRAARPPAVNRSALPKVFPYAATTETGAVELAER
eukprot:3671008-Amphidinium_carterae.1